MLKSGLMMQEQGRIGPFCRSGFRKLFLKGDSFSGEFLRNRWADFNVVWIKMFFGVFRIPGFNFKIISQKTKSL